VLLLRWESKLLTHGSSVDRVGVLIAQFTPRVVTTMIGHRLGITGVESV
jgi:hypothetical protein